MAGHSPAYPLTVETDGPLVFGQGEVGTHDNRIGALGHGAKAEEALGHFPKRCCQAPSVR